ncbi:MAG: LptF/LptG family permease [Candidatus Melainabacteria bacterium]|nr:LptF/LptG family permease [Candidatus Melainabacteria bacterium]
MSIFKIFDRYSYTEFLTLTAAGTTLPAGLLLFTEETKRMMQYVKDFGCPIDTFLFMTILQLPEIVVRCMPGGILIGAMLFLSKMVADREIVALQTCGISKARIFQPFIVIAISAAYLSVLINEFAVPACLKASMKMTILAANNRDIPICNGINDFKGFKCDEKGKVQQIFLVASRKGGELANTVLINVTDKENIQLTVAEKGFLKSDAWTLFNGNIYNITEDKVQAYQSSHFEKMQITPPDKSKFLLENRDPFSFELNTMELLQQFDKLKAQGKPITSLMRLDLSRRFTDPLACLVITLACFPLMLMARGKRKAYSIVYGALILIGYFTLRSISGGLAENGVVAPELAALLPCILIVGLSSAFTALVIRQFN